jgi:DNA invertase Pin-like site-specific DNA recombinase
MTASSPSRAPARAAPPRAWRARPESVEPWHQERLAVVYVRQSTPQQVLDHQESTRLQYGLTARARELGWAPERVVVVDDDLGRSGTSAADRLGFQRLVSEVGLGHVGLILGVEMSRLARSGKDWHQLLELCALFGTLIADSDGVYDPGQYNDRLLLGLKGTLSEAELHLLKQRMHQGVLNKARRGALAVGLPTGYARRASGEAVFDPDEQVQHVVRLIFRKFAELGTLNALLHYLVAHRVQVGIRVRERVGRGELVWRRPSRVLLQNMLKSPVYAGAYAYGRRPAAPRRHPPGPPPADRVVVGAAAWLVLLRDRLPAYITWEQYEHNLARLAANRARSDAVGAVRHGPALLTGLAICAGCGCRMTVRYSGRADRHTYVCNRQRTDYGGEACQHVAGPCLDRFVGERVLAALAPAALELSLAAAAHLARERDDLARLWQHRRERAAYEAERAGRQYHLVEPENRLVARQLEREWEEKLAARRRLEEEYDRVADAQPRALTAAEREAIRRLAADIPALWGAASTTAADRKEIVRQVVDRVVVDARGTNERVGVAIAWAGGARTEGELVRPVAKLAQLSYYPALAARVRALAAAGLAAPQIAERLNAEGFRPPKRRERFGRQGVNDLLHQLGVRPPRARAPHRAGLGPHERGIAELAGAIGMPAITLYTWVRRGWVTARRVDPPSGRWAVWADDAEIERLRQLHRRPPGHDQRRRWADDADAAPPSAAAPYPTAR